MAKAIKQLLVKGEDFLLKRHLDGVLKSLVDPTLRDFNFDRFSAADVSVATIKERLVTLPMMADFRVLVIEDFQILGKEDLEVLLPVLVDSELQTHVILIADKIDKRTAFYKTFSTSGEVLEFKKPYANQLPVFVQEEARRLGLSFERGAGELLVDVVGGELTALVTEISKLALYVHPLKMVSAKHVRDSVARGLVDNVFLLGNLIGERKLAAAEDLFRRMVEQGENAVKIIALVIGHFRKLLLAREALALGTPVSLASILKVSPYFAKDYETQTKRFALAELKSLYKTLMNVSEDLRSSRVDRDLIFGNFLSKACISDLAV